LVLGSDVCAKAALFYLVKYMTKDSAEMNASLSVLADARRHMDKYPSTAEDSGSGSRNVKHFIQRALQRMDMELADTQAASCAMGEMADFWTDMFVRLHLHATMQGAVRLSRGLSILGSVDDDGDGSVSASDVCESDPSLPSDGDDCDADEADMLLAGCSGRLEMQGSRERPRTDISGPRRRRGGNAAGDGEDGAEAGGDGCLELFVAESGLTKALPAVYHYAYRGSQLYLWALRPNGVARCQLFSGIFFVKKISRIPRRYIRATNAHKKST
jgi:hypothetical protein